MRSQSKPSVTVKVVLIAGIQTNAPTVKIWPTLEMRGVKSISERP